MAPKINTDIAALIIVVLLGAMYYYVALGTPLVFGDEDFYASQSRAIVQSGMLPAFDNFHSTDIFHIMSVRPPIYTLISTAGYALLGEFGIKLLIPLFTMLSGLIVYMLLKRMGKPGAGLAAAFLLMVIPGIVTYGVMNYVETSLLLFFLLTVYLSSLSFEKKSMRYAVMTGIAMAFAVLTDTTGIFAPAILLFFFIMIAAKSKFDKDILKLFGVMIIVGLVLVAPFFARQMALWGSLCYPPFINVNDCEAVRDIAIPHSESLKFDAAVAPTGVGLPIITFGLLNYASFAFGIPLLVLVCLGAAMLFARKDNMSRMLMVWFVLFLIITVGTALMVRSDGSTVRSEDAVRFTLFGFPVLAVISGMFFSEIYNRFKKYDYIVFIVVAMALFASFFFGLQKLEGMDQIKSGSYQGLMAACDWVRANAPADSIIYATYAHQTAWLCDRSAKTTVPDKAEIALTNNDTSYEHLKMHGYDYVLIEAFTVSNSRYEEGNTGDFVNYLLTSDKFKKVYDNTNVYGQNGILIFQVL